MDFAIWLTHALIFSFLIAHHKTERGTRSKPSLNLEKRRMYFSSSACIFLATNGLYRQQEWFLYGL